MTAGVLVRRRPFVPRAAALAFLLGAGSLAAQEETGKLEGAVRDSLGSPIASAQIYFVGTAYAALSDPRGHYFINNIPAGTWSVLARFLGYHPVRTEGLKILGGQTVTLD